MAIQTKVTYNAVSQKGWFVGVLTGVIILFIGATLFFFFRSPKQDGYSAVFLTNGQVYFGEIISQKNHTIVLTHIYYLQTNTADPKAEVTEANMSLVKLGNELHGPTDEMQINRDHVLFIETLRTDSKVVQAITSQQP